MNEPRPALQIQGERHSLMGSLCRHGPGIVNSVSDVPYTGIHCNPPAGLHYTRLQTYDWPARTITLVGVAELRVRTMHLTTERCKCLEAIQYKAHQLP